MENLRGDVWQVRRMCVGLETWVQSQPGGRDTGGIITDALIKAMGAASEVTLSALITLWEILLFPGRAACLGKENNPSHGNFDM